MIDATLFDTGTADNVGSMVESFQLINIFINICIGLLAKGVKKVVLVALPCSIATRLLWKTMLKSYLGGDAAHTARVFFVT